MFGPGSVLPLEYFLGFLDFLDRYHKQVEFLTYDDLDWDGDDNHENWFPKEWARWKSSILNGHRDPEKIYVLIQHDVDANPERTMAILKAERAKGIPSNVMLFRNNVDYSYCRKTNKPMRRWLDYSLDFSALKVFEKDRFVFGYHSNAYEQAAYNEVEALSRFEDDVSELRRHLRIRYFSPHGGNYSPDGRNNFSLKIPGSLQGSLRWVNNYYGARFPDFYGDGGFESNRHPRRDRDLRNFVKHWKPGHRYLIHTHPQYYHTPCGRSPRMSGESWYEAVLSTSGHNSWRDVRLDRAVKE